MPLLNKRRISFTPHMRPEMKRRRKQVYYLKCTKEVFPTYESYIKRWTLCNRPIWECEATGRQHLTYKQAQESEQADQNRVEYKFCPVLRKQLLSHIQFQTSALDNLAHDLFNSYLHDFATGEVVFCLLGGHTYLGQIMDVIQNPNYIPAPSSYAATSSDPNIKNEQGETTVPRQANGRLRFPDAFLHPEPDSSADAPLGSDDDENPQQEHQQQQQQQQPADQHHGNGNNNNISLPLHPPHRFKYRVQLVNSDGTPLEKNVRILDVGELSRDPHWFNPTMLRRLIRESATRDSYVGAPWLLKEHVAAHHGIPTTLPTSLQQLQDQAYLDMIKKRQPHFPRTHTLTSNDNNSVDQNHQHLSHHHHHHHHQHHPGMNGDSATNSSWFIHNGAFPSSASPSSSSMNAFDMPIMAKEEREAEKQARKEEHARIKIQQKLEKDRIREERKKQAAVKYPIEDLDLPIYRKDPNHHWVLVDMTPTSYSQQLPSSPSILSYNNDPQQPQLVPGSQGMVVYQGDDKNQVRIPYPCGGRGPRPIPNERSCVGILDDQQFESMMAVWSFLTVFSVPLQLPTMTIETFESSLVSTGNNSAALISSFASLLNVIIKERMHGTTSDIVNGDLVDDYLQENDITSDDENNDNDDDDEDDNDEDEEEQPATPTTKRQTRQSTRSRTSQQQQKVNTTTAIASTTTSNTSTPKDTTTSSPSSASVSLGWRDAEPLRICKDWDQKEIKPDRKNWIVALIGCLNDVATPDLVPGMDDLLHHLLPRAHCTIAERDRQFSSLEPEKKLQLLAFLMDATNETLVIKNYMDKCQDQMTELRRQKVELNKEYKLLAVRRAALEKQAFQQQQQQEMVENATVKMEKDTTATAESNQDTNDSTTEMDEDDIDDEDRDDMDPADDDDSADDDGQSDESDTDEEDESASDDEEDSVASDSEEPSGRRTSKRQSKYGQLHRSRQAKLQKKRQQRQEQAIKSENAQKRRRQASAKKRQESSKGALKQQKQQQQQQQQQPPPEKQMTPLDERQQLDEEEQELKRKEDQLEREMRQYMTLRIRPLGKDRFFQRYLYLDNVGTPDHHGTGRLYVQSPTYVDILQLMDRDHHPSSNGVVSGPPLSMIPVTATTTNTGQSPSATVSTPNGHSTPSQGEGTAINHIATPAWGRGGGREFVLELMREQGLLAEREWMMERMDELQQQQDEMNSIPGKLTHSMCSDHPVLSNHLHRRKQTSGGSWWYYYSNPYQIQQLLAWLNPKGVREYKLRNEIIKQQHYLVESMQKHEEMENEPPVHTPSSASPMTTRVTRNKKA